MIAEDSYWLLRGNEVLVTQPVNDKQQQLSPLVWQFLRRVNAALRDEGVLMDAAESDRPILQSARRRGKVKRDQPTFFRSRSIFSCNIYDSIRRDFAT